MALDISTDKAATHNSAWRHHTLIFLAYLALSFVLLYPMPLHLADSSFYLSPPEAAQREDTLINSAIIYHKARHLISGEWGKFHDLPDFYPYAQTALFNDILLTHALLFLPFVAVGVDAHTTHNILSFIGFPVSGFCMFLLALHILRSRGIAFICGTCYALCPYQLNHLIHFNLRLVMFYPLALLFMIRFFDTGQRKHLVAACAFFLAHALANGYYFLFGNIFLVVFGLGLLAHHRKRLNALPWALVASLTTGTFALIAFLLYPYFDFASRHDLHGGNVLYAASMSNYVQSFPANWIWGRLIGKGYGERTLFWGLMPSALLLWGATTGRVDTHWRWLRFVCAICTGLAILLSLGPVANVGDVHVKLPYYYIARYLPGFGALRVTSRMALFVVLFGSLLIGFGMSALLDGLGHRRTKLAEAVCLLLIVLEFGHMPLPRTQVLSPDPDRDRVLAWLRDNASGAPIFNLPTGTGFDGIQAQYTYSALDHHSRLIGGKSSAMSPLFKEMRDFTRTKLSDQGGATRLLEMLRALGVQYVVSWGPSKQDADIFSSLDAASERFNQKARFGHNAIYEVRQSRLRHLRQEKLDFHFEVLRCNKFKPMCLLRFQSVSPQRDTFFLFNDKRSRLAHLALGGKIATAYLLLPVLVPTQEPFHGELRFDVFPLWVNHGNLLQLSSEDGDFQAFGGDFSIPSKTMPLTGSEHWFPGKIGNIIMNTNLY